MLTGLKLSSLACKCIFYRQNEMQILNIQMDRALKVHERNGAMLQLLHLFPDLLSLKCQKWSFFIFSTDSKKKVHLKDRT